MQQRLCTTSSTHPGRAHASNRQAALCAIGAHARLAAAALLQHCRMRRLELRHAQALHMQLVQGLHDALHTASVHAAPSQMSNSQALLLCTAPVQSVGGAYHVSCLPKGMTYLGLPQCALVWEGSFLSTTCSLSCTNVKASRPWCSSAVHTASRVDAQPCKAVL